MKIKVLLSIALPVLLLTACSLPFTGAKGVAVKVIPTNILTGLPGSNGPVLAVKIDDTPPAHPQIGLEHADVVYIEQVEGGLTRLATIFSQYPESVPEKIGPVRSARISDLEILSQYGKVGFAFSGAQRKLYPKIDAANLINLSADRNPANIYSRDHSRFAPTTVPAYARLEIPTPEQDGSRLCASSPNRRSRQIGAAHQVAVALAGGAAAFVESPYDEALAAAAVAGGEDLRDARAVFAVVGLHI